MPSTGTRDQHKRGATNRDVMFLSATSLLKFTPQALSRLLNLQKIHYAKGAVRNFRINISEENLEKYK